MKNFLRIASSILSVFVLIVLLVKSTTTPYLSFGNSTAEIVIIISGMMAIVISSVVELTARIFRGSSDEDSTAFLRVISAIGFAVCITTLVFFSEVSGQVGAKFAIVSILFMFAGFTRIIAECQSVLRVKTPTAMLV